MTYTNPSVAEIKDWAFSGKEWPIEEWDLFLSWTCEVELFIALATDHKCPQKSFFLHMLYYTVGATYTSSRSNDRFSRIAFYAEKGRLHKHGDIKRWVSEVDLLLSGNKKYDYQDWRAGRLAGYQFN